MAEIGLTENRPYTVGVVIAVILIILIALLHVSRLIFKQIRKRNESKIIPVEIPTSNGARRISSAVYIQEIELVGNNPRKTSLSKNRKCFHHSFNNASKTLKKTSSRRKEIRKLSFAEKSRDEDVMKFFHAGYSHRHLNEDF